MNRGIKRGLVKGLTAIVLTLSPIIPQPIYAQRTRQERRRIEKYQTITVNRRKYYIYPNKKHDKIQDEKGRIVTSQNILRDIMFTYIINKRFQNYQAEQNLKNFNRSRTKTQLMELFRGYVTVLRAPFSRIIQNLREERPGSLLTKANIIRSLYEGTKEVLTNLYLDQRMYMFADLTAHSIQAERDYKRFISLLRQPLTEYRRAKKVFDLALRSEHIIKAAPGAFKEFRKSGKRINKQEQTKFNEALKKGNTRILQQICNKIQSRARSSKEYKDYLRDLTKEKGNSLAYKLQQEIRRKGLRKVFESNL